MSTSTAVARHIGFCPCCGKDFKVLNGCLVHHGYLRPGIGSIVGDCMGVGWQPHELSPELAKRYLAGLVRQNEKTTKLAEALPNATRLGCKDHRGQVTTLVKGECPDWEWRQAYKSAEWSLRSELKGLEREMTRVQGLVDTWEPKPLTTVMEEKAAMKAAKAERESAAKAKKAAKVADYVERCQKRIDSAVRRRNPKSLARIYEDAPYKLQELHWNKVTGTISRADALKLLDRDNVWQALGLLTSSGYVDDRKAPGSDVLRKMSWNDEYTWPEGL